MTLHSLLGFRRDRRVILLCAITLTTALGVLGAGHGGRSYTNLDMRFLYLAGLQWHEGFSAYAPIRPRPVDPWLAEALGRSDFAYPPQIAPLCLLLARFSPVGARDLMTGLNVVAALMLAAFRARLARDRKPGDPGAPGDGSAWLVPTIVLGNFSTAFVVWAGQTTLIVTLALMLGWHYARRDRWLVGGLLLAISTIKPQLTLLAIIWLLLERRWRVLAV